MNFFFSYPQSYPYILMEIKTDLWLESQPFPLFLLEWFKKWLKQDVSILLYNLFLNVISKFLGRFL